MFRNKQTMIFLFVEALLPFVIPFFGLPAVYCYISSQWDALEIWHSAALSTVFITCLTEFLLGFISFILMLVNLFRQNKIPYATTEHLILWIASGFFLLNAIIQLLLIQGFTYGQGI